MAQAHHVTVVGAGIVGVCAGLALLRDGHAVTIVDRDGPGENCSFGNAGIISDTNSALPLPSPEVVRDIPKMLLDRRRSVTVRWTWLPRLLPWLGAFLKSAGTSTRLANAEALFALLDGTTDAWDRMTRGTPGAELIRKRGLLFVYRTDRGFAKGVRERRILVRLGADAVELDAHEVRQMEPALSDDIRHAHYCPGEYQTVNPYRLTSSLADCFVAEGGTLERAEVTGIGHGAGRVRDLRTTRGERKVDRLVISAGAWSHRLAAMLGVRVLLDTERGYHTVFHGVQSGLSRPVIHGEEHFGVSQMDEGLRFAGTVELAGLEAPPDYRRADVIAERGRHVLRAFDPSAADKVTRWMGRRPTLPDYLPAMGGLAGFSNVWCNFGHQHLGLTLAARSGLVIADLIAGRDPGLDMAPFRPDRF